MKFYVVTPSFNQLDFLKRCVASVADQVSADSCELTANSSITVHHHIQDACSTDGTVEWLKEFAAQQPATSNYQLTFASEADNGMYDAINRGWKRAVAGGFCTGEGESGRKGEGTSFQRSEDGGLRSDDGFNELNSFNGSSDNCQPSTNNPHDSVLAHLNCDEQYLPGALQTIADYFSSHQKVDVAMADMIVVDNNGAYICHRRSLKPNALLSRTCCVGMTTTTFQRASVVRDKGVLFDTSWRNIGDMVWYNKLHEAGVRYGVCNKLVSVFADTGDNLNLTEEAIRERKRYAKEYLWGLRWPTQIMSKMYSLRRFLKDFYLASPDQYALYWNALDKREVREIEKPTPLWHRKGPSLQGRAGKGVAG